MRNPERVVPAGSSCLAPADGYVVYVNRVDKGQVPIAIKRGNKIPLDEIFLESSLHNSSGYQIGVFMTAMSVHYNRIPLAGTILKKVRRQPEINRTTARLMTHILIYRKPYEELCEHIIENDRITLTIMNRLGKYYLTQIADKWISNIINELQIGDEVERGSVYGMIRFGSQVDIFLPDQLGYEPVVSPGDYVFAGETVVASQINENDD